MSRVLQSKKMQDPKWTSRKFDKTSLRAHVQGYQVHRDYAAHFFRWGWVSRRYIDPTKNVLDIGCGPDGALARVLSYKANGIPKSYLGVDLNCLNQEDMPGYKWCSFRGNFNFSEQWRELENCGPYEVITCFEVVEHMNMTAMRQLLRGALQLLAPEGRMILSTPVFNGHQAKNHINEMTVATLQEELEKAGWAVLKRYGTFMSDGDRKKAVSGEENALVDRLKEYYSTDVLACFLAPLYPDHSRNNVWICADAFEV
jgi:2-polyprenyl-3-methyl-5-hydroxy-6-metoxy-1,4-benzoquinol methylase